MRALSLMGLLIAPVAVTAQEVTEVWECLVPAGCEGEDCMQAVSPMMIFFATLPDGQDGVALAMPSGTLPAAVISEEQGTRRLRVGRKDAVAPVSLVSLGEDGSGLVSLRESSVSYTVSASCATVLPRVADE